MIIIQPTKRLLGAELWATQKELYDLYELIGRYWESSDDPDCIDDILACFSYDVRKAHTQCRLYCQTDPREKGAKYIEIGCQEAYEKYLKHLNPEEVEQSIFGVRIIWPSLFLYLSALRYRMGCRPNSQKDIAILDELVQKTKEALESVHKPTAKKLYPYL